MLKLNRNKYVFIIRAYQEICHTRKYLKCCQIKNGIGFELIFFVKLQLCDLFSTITMPWGLQKIMAQANEEPNIFSTAIFPSKSHWENMTSQKTVVWQINILSSVKSFWIFTSEPILDSGQCGPNKNTWKLQYFHHLTASDTDNSIFRQFPSMTGVLGNSGLNRF